VDIQEGFDSNYRFVLVAARRARQLQNGSRPMVDTISTKACRVAQDEIIAGKVQYTRTTDVVRQPEIRAEDLPPVSEI
jgi:DNA-directed RNA polymerase subunit omega